jgi:hypothetical protein
MTGVYALENEIPPDAVGPQGAVVNDSEFKDGKANPGAYHCARCRSHITDEGQRIEVGGKSDHVQMNPHGLVFHFRTFGDAKGAQPVGEGERDWSWFAGTAWRLALCGQCRAHLGWSFSGQGGDFFGLVLDRLIFDER